MCWLTFVGDHTYCHPSFKNWLLDLFPGLLTQSKAKKKTDLIFVLRSNVKDFPHEYLKVKQSPTPILTSFGKDQLNENELTWKSTIIDPEQDVQPLTPLLRYMKGLKQNYLFLFMEEKVGHLQEFLVALPHENQSPKKLDEPILNTFWYVYKVGVDDIHDYLISKNVGQLQTLTVNCEENTEIKKRANLWTNPTSANAKPTDVQVKIDEDNTESTQGKEEVNLEDETAKTDHRLLGRGKTSSSEVTRSLIPQQFPKKRRYITRKEKLLTQLTQKVQEHAQLQAYARGNYTSILPKQTPTSQQLLITEHKGQSNNVAAGRSGPEVSNTEPNTMVLSPPTDTSKLEECILLEEENGKTRSTTSTQESLSPSGPKSEPTSSIAMHLPTTADSSVANFIIENQSGDISNVLLTLDASGQIISCQALSCENGHLTSSPVVNLSNRSEKNPSIMMLHPSESTALQTSSMDGKNLENRKKETTVNNTLDKLRHKLIERRKVKEEEDQRKLFTTIRGDDGSPTNSKQIGQTEGKNNMGADGRQTGSKESVSADAPQTIMKKHIVPGTGKSEKKENMGADDGKTTCNDHMDEGAGSKKWRKHMDRDTGKFSMLKEGMVADGGQKKSKEDMDADAGQSKSNQDMTVNGRQTNGKPELVANTEKSESKEHMGVNGSQTESKEGTAGVLRQTQVKKIVGEQIGRSQPNKHIDEMSELETTDQEIFLEDNWSADDEDESTHDEDGGLDRYEEKEKKMEHMNGKTLGNTATKKKNIDNEMVKGQKNGVDNEDDDKVEVIGNRKDKKRGSGSEQKLPKVKETSLTTVGITGETLQGELKDNTVSKKYNEQHDVKKKKVITGEVKDLTIITTEDKELEEEEKKGTGSTDGTCERNEITDYMKNKEDVLKTCRKKNLQEEKENNVAIKEKSDNMVTKTKHQSNDGMHPVGKNGNEENQDIKNQDIGLNLLAEAAAKVSEGKDKKMSVHEEKGNSKKGKGNKSHVQVDANQKSKAITLKSDTQGKHKERKSNKLKKQETKTEDDLMKTQVQEQVKLSDVTKEDEDEVFQDKNPERIQKNGRRCKYSGPTNKLSQSHVKSEENTSVRKNQKQNSSKIEGKEQSPDMGAIEKKDTSPLINSTSLGETFSLISEASKSTDMGNDYQSTENANNKNGKENVATPPFEMNKKCTNNTIPIIHDASTTGSHTPVPKHQNSWHETLHNHEDNYSNDVLQYRQCNIVKGGNTQSTSVWNQRNRIDSTTPNSSDQTNNSLTEMNSSFNIQQLNGQSSSMNVHQLNCTLSSQDLHGNTLSLHPQPQNSTLTLNQLHRDTTSIHGQLQNSTFNSQQFQVNTSSMNGQGQNSTFNSQQFQVNTSSMNGQGQNSTFNSQQFQVNTSSMNGQGQNSTFNSQQFPGDTSRTHGQGQNSTFNSQQFQGDTSRTHGQGQNSTFNSPTISG